MVAVIETATRATVETILLLALSIGRISTYVSCLLESGFA